MITVVVSTYEKPRHLELVLAGLGRQTDADFEVIVADDGSGATTREVVEAFVSRAPVPVRHIWQEDDGFRAARVRNLGVAAARGDWIVFLDGDCIPFPDFVAAHRRAARSRDVVAAGARLFLDREPSESLTVGDVEDGSFVARLPRAQFHSVRWRALKNRVYRATRLKERPKVVTANLGLARSALDDVNGLDERFVGWGHEDEDLRRRLVARGHRIRSVYRSARVCHLWHPHASSFRGRVRHGDNVEYFERGFYLSRCRLGLTERSMESLVTAWNGEIARPRPPTASAGAPAAPARAELAIAWEEGARFAPDAEVRVSLRRARSRRPADGGSRQRRDSLRCHFELRTGAERSCGLTAAADGPPHLASTDDPDPHSELGRRRILELLAPVI